MLVEGRGQYVWDDRGRRYLDAFAGIVTVSVGHCHPAVTAAMAAQLARLQHTTTIYLHPQTAVFAEELAARMPGDLKASAPAPFPLKGSAAPPLRSQPRRTDAVACRRAAHMLRRRRPCRCATS